MAPRSLTTALAILAALGSVSAQTWSDCNPMNKTCPPNPALGSSAGFDMSMKTNPKVWNTTAGPMTYGGSGAEFTIKSQGQSPTIQSNFYIMFGSVSVVMQAAKGQGVISSIVLESDDLDEVDWEFMGGNRTHVESNFFGKGNTTSYDRAIYHPVPTAPQDGFHNYTVHWTQEQMEWWIDDKKIRTLAYNGPGTLDGYNYPQTPMNVRLGIWAGGDPKQPKGVIEWAGGVTPYNEPYTMFVKTVNVTDFSSGKEYTWTDRSGSWQSIKATAGNSTILTAINAPTGISGFWSRISAGAKSGLIIGSIAGASILVLALLACCIVQGRKGRREKAIADAAYDKEQAEFNQYRLQMMKGGFSSTTHETLPSAPTPAEYGGGYAYQQSGGQAYQQSAGHTYRQGDGPGYQQNGGYGARF